MLWQRIPSGLTITFPDGQYQASTAELYWCSHESATRSINFSPAEVYWSADMCSHESANTNICSGSLQIFRCALFEFVHGWQIASQRSNLCCWPPQLGFGRSTAFPSAAIRCTFSALSKSPIWKALQTKKSQTKKMPVHWQRAFGWSSLF